MTKSIDLPGLQIISHHVPPTHVSFRPKDWPPAKDFPVIVDAGGKVVSRFGDPFWVLTPWMGRPLLISFGDGESRSITRMDSGNANLLRTVDAWWLYGPGATQTAGTLAAKHNAIKPLFVACAEAGIPASQLSRFPAVIEEVARRIRPTDASKVISRLNDLRAFRDALGFELLDEAGLKLLARLLPKHESVQTAYIPPRIWTYQVKRLRNCLDDYCAHRNRIEDCYRFCLDAYQTNSKAVGCDANKIPKYSMPFSPSVRSGYSLKGRKYHGPFRLTAERYGIAELLSRWTDFSDSLGIVTLSKYLSLVSDVGQAYLMNFSLMRIDEASQLRVGCYEVDESTDDDVHLIGAVPTLTGVTTKTVQDGGAKWIVSPSCSVAVEVMTSVALLRTHARTMFGGQQKGDGSPFLRCRSYEPWSSSGGESSLAVRPKARSYLDILKAHPTLFDSEELRITEDDNEIAMSMTFGLDQGSFGVGRVWPLAWHQLRRTGACNMLGSGLVSEASLQYELKHLNRASSLYYGQNYLKLKCQLDEEAKGYYLREMYSMMARELVCLQDDRYVSPHGKKRKAQVLVEISAKDHESLVADAKMGKVCYRQTFLGGCAKSGAPCPLGGITNITGCLGHGDQAPCESVVVDREKRSLIIRLLGTFEEKLRDAPVGSPLQASIEASIESAKRAIDVIDTF